MSHNKKLRLTRAAFLAFAIISISIVLYRTNSTTAPGASNAASGTEPIVRIGIIQKTDIAKIQFSGPFKVYTKDTADSPLSFRKNTVLVEMLTVRLADLQTQYNVILGQYRSYEQADYVASLIRPKYKDFEIVQQKQWALWFGPYASLGDAENMRDWLASNGYPNTRVEPARHDVHLLSVNTSGGTPVHAGEGSVTFVPASGRFTIGKRSYRGSVEIIPDRFGTFTVVNRVATEDYLYSVLPREMPASAHPEALKAQAVIARTYMMKNFDKHSADGFNLCSTTDCQVYGGASEETAATTAAVDSTRGMLLTHNGEIANALFHSTCGGRTASYGDIWNGNAPPYLSAVDDGAGTSAPLSSASAVSQFLSGKTANCSKSKYLRWTKEYTSGEMQALLESTIPEFTNNPALRIGPVTDIQVVSYSPSGRVQKITITAGNDRYTFEKDAIRWIFGSLKSTFFVLSRQPSSAGVKYVFTGAGWGHGVGLCQIGAMEMARGGAPFREILSHYYSGSRVEKFWN